PSALYLLAEMLRVERFAAGAVVCEAGEAADSVFVVAEGALAVEVRGRPARSLVKGDVFGEYGLFAGGVRTARVRADTDAALLSVDYTRFREYLLMFPHAMMALFSAAVTRLIEREARDAGT